MKIINNIYRNGTATPLVLIHAFPIDHRMWDECAERIISISDQLGLERFSVMAPDMPGAGLCAVPDAEESGKELPDGSYPEALDRLTDAYADIVQQAGFSSAVWVGLSMGGYVALNMQRRHPDLVAAIALCDTKAEQDSEQARNNRLRIALECETTLSVEPVLSFAVPQPTDSTIKKSEEFVARFTRSIQEQNPNGIAWRQRMAAGRDDLTDQLALITAPSAVVCGALDPSSPPQVMSAIAQDMSNTDAVLTVIENCGHFSALEHPDTVAQAIVDLVARAQATSIKTQE